MRVAIVDYGSGNLRSAEKAFQRAAETRGGGADIVVTDDPQSVATAERVVLPGVGAFADCRAGLDGVPGLTEALREAVERRARPFLGICVGMQLMATRGREYVTTEGLDWIPGEVVRLTPSDPACKIPHMGWNTLRATNDHPLLAGIETGDAGLHAFFVHSYHLDAESDDDVVATVDHGMSFAAIVARANMAGTQFHPEKSQRLGLALIGNFLEWKP